ncbi:DNA polymerase I [bacterium]|nr:DNA polymerase I [bacterium]
MTASAMSKPTKEFLKDAIYLVDASSFIFRAYYGIQAPLTAPDGTPTHATYAFVQMVESLVATEGIERIALIWDRKEKGFRHDLFPEYKANRDAPPEDLSIQIENSQKIMDFFGTRQFSYAGFEADDVIATAVHNHPKQNFVIVTADKDLLQLVTDHVWCLDTMKKKWSNQEEAFEKFGVMPDKIPELQALCGDSVDNIPGAPGIGPKTAAQLMEQFGDLQSILDEAVKRHANPAEFKKVKDALKGKKIEKLAENVDQVKLSLKLVTLSKDVPLEKNLDLYTKNPEQTDELIGFATELGFHKIVQRHASSANANAANEAKKNVKFTLIEDIKQLERILEDNQTAKLLSFDTETKSLASRKANNIVGLSFCFNSQEAYYVAVDHTEGPNLDKKKVLKAFESFFKDYSLTNLVFQNAKFDFHVLASEGLRIPAKIDVEDTMIASFVLDPSEPHGMDALAQKYLDGYQTIKFKDVLGDKSNFGEISPKDAADYAAEDAWVTLRLWKKLENLLHECELWEVYERLDRPLVPILFEMEEVGVDVDKGYLAELSKKFHKAEEDCKKTAFKILNDFGVEVNPDTLNLGSTKQIAKILFEDLKLPIIKKGKTGPSTDVSVLQELENQHPFPSLLLEYRELTKLLSTYVDAFPKLIDENTGHIHTDFSQIIAQTGRLASSNPNLQNIPTRTTNGQLIRKAFNARKGHKLLGVDYSQIELRMLAHVSEAENLVKAFQDDADIHRRTAALIFGKEESKVTDDERRAAKTINFGIIYGQSAFGLSKTLKISRSDAQQFIDNYFKSYPQIKDYMDESIRQAQETGFATTITGRRRALRDIQSKNATVRKFAERMAINSPLQGSSADLMKAAMIRVSHEMKKAKVESKMILQVHDELIFEVPNKEVEQMKTLVVSSLESDDLLASFGIHGFKVKMKAVAETADSWGEL